MTRHPQIYNPTKTNLGVEDTISTAAKRHQSARKLVSATGHLYPITVVISTWWVYKWDLQNLSDSGRCISYKNHIGSTTNISNQWLTEFSLEIYCIYNVYHIPQEYQLNDGSTLLSIVLTTVLSIIYIFNHACAELFSENTRIYVLQA